MKVRTIVGEEHKYIIRWIPDERCIGYVEVCVCGDYESMEDTKWETFMECISWEEVEESSDEELYDLIEDMKEYLF